MPVPTRLRELPWGVLRAAFGPARCVLLVQPGLFRSTEIARLATNLSAADQARPFWVFAFPRSALNTTGRAFVLTPPPAAQVNASGHANYDAAEAAFEAAARTHAGKSGVDRGPKGLLRIGTED